MAACPRPFVWDLQLNDEEKVPNHSVGEIFGFLRIGHAPKPTSRTKVAGRGIVPGTYLHRSASDHLTGLGYVSLYKRYKTTVSTTDLKAGNDAWEH